MQRDFQGKMGLNVASSWAVWAQISWQQLKWGNGFNLNVTLLDKDRWLSLLLTGLSISAKSACLSLVKQATVIRKADRYRSFYNKWASLLTQMAFPFPLPNCAFLAFTSLLLCTEPKSESSQAAVCWKGLLSLLLALTITAFKNTPRELEMAAAGRGHSCRTIPRGFHEDMLEYRFRGKKIIASAH